MTRNFWPIILCWLTVLIEGYDLVAFGVTIPTVLNNGALGFTPAAATAVATISLVGVAIGASGTGPIADRFGRRGVLVASVLLFSIFTVIVPLSPNPLVFGIFRLIAGVGLGACMPTALAVMSETLPARHRASSSTITMTGYHVGAVATSLLALAFGANWEALYYVGGTVGLVLAGVLWLKLPESAAFLAAKANVHAERTGPRDVLTTPRYRRISIAVWVGSFMGLLLVYGLNTWLPQIMRTAGYAMSASVTLLLVLNTGAIIGLLVAGLIADRRGIKPTVVLWFGIAAAFLALLSLKISSSLLLNLVVLATGIFVFSSQVLIFSYVVRAFPPQVRGTALGLTSGIGRLGAIVGPFVTGALVTAGIAYPWGFWLFAVVAAFGLCAMLAVPRTPATEREPEITAVPGT